MLLCGDDGDNNCDENNYGSSANIDSGGDSCNDNDSDGCGGGGGGGIVGSNCGSNARGSGDVGGGSGDNDYGGSYYGKCDIGGVVWRQRW